MLGIDFAKLNLCSRDHVAGTLYGGCFKNPDILRQVARRTGYGWTATYLAVEGRDVWLK